MAQQDSPKPTIVVIGAGIIGLTSAIKLQDLITRKYGPNSIDILIVARDWPSSIPGAPLQHPADYASMWAGAHIRPIPASTLQLKREAEWLKMTVNELKQHLEAEPFVGITALQGIEYLEAPDDAYRSQTKESFESETGLIGYKKLEGSQIPKDVSLAFSYPTYCINAPLYCQSLLRKFLVRGGKTLLRNIRSEQEAFSLASNVKVVVNASGIGFGDAKCFPTRGQTVITNLTSATKTVTRQNKDGTWNFIIPRFFNGGTVIGGTKEPNDWRTEASLETRNHLLNRGKGLSAFACDSEVATAELQVIADVVGRRPTREGGMRLEIEQQNAGTVIHAYGAGGRGYEIGWGVASEVSQLAESILQPQTAAVKARL